LPRLQEVRVSGFAGSSFFGSLVAAFCGGRGVLLARHAMDYCAMTVRIGHDGPMPVVPPKLRRGSSVRVTAPSGSLAIIGSDVRAEADRKLAALELKISFGEHVGDCDDFDSSSVEARLAAVHAAFADPWVDGVLAVIGGFQR
jgi:LD-carboxypeptidase N-terminal domain